VQKLTEVWGRQVVVDDRPGAGGTIAAEIVARSVRDVYVMLVHSTGFAITPSLYKLKYDAIKDFTPVTLLTMRPRFSS
jgi:tripartite-type tricarboxylate transporter receptor subunit TctC